MPRKKKQKVSHNIPTRISSRQAAEIIENRSAPLIVLVSDASGGGDCSGIAAILRRTSPGSSASSDHARIVLGRFPWDESSASESGAVALGLKVLLEEEDLDEYAVLVISDCETALDFYDLASEYKLRDELVDGPGWVNAMEYVCLRAKRGVFLAKVKSAHGKESGFFDHEAADLLSVKARDPGVHEKHRSEWRGGVPPLDRASLVWLQESESAASQRKKKGGSGPRKQRCEIRIRGDLKIAWFSLKNDHE